MEKKSDILIAINSVLFDGNMGKNLINGIIEKEFGVKAKCYLREGDTESPRAQYMNNPDFFGVDIDTLSEADCYDYFCGVYEELCTDEDLLYDEFLEANPEFNLNLKKLAARYQELYFTHPEINDERSRLLETIGEGRYLYAVWSNRDKGIKYKLERSGLKSYFKDCFICNSYERDYGKSVMSKSYYEKTIRKTVDENRATSYVPIVLISDYEGFYKKGSYYNTIYYDPHSMIHWERDSGYVAHSFDEIIEVVNHLKK